MENIDLNRKMLANLAVTEPKSFGSVVNTVKQSKGFAAGGL